MPVRESKVKANARYDKAHCINYCLKLNKGTDADIMAKLDSVPNKQGYIKSLIRQDVKPVPDSDSVPVSFPADIMDKLKREADKAKMSVPDFVSLIICTHLNRI